MRGSERQNPASSLVLGPSSQASSSPSVGATGAASRSRRHVAPRCPSLPTTVPAPARTPAENPGFSTWQAKFARDTDCLLEGDGFEPSVPLYILTISDPLLSAP